MSQVIIHTGDMYVRKIMLTANKNEKKNTNELFLVNAFKPNELTFSRCYLVT